MNEDLELEEIEELYDKEEDLIEDENTEIEAEESDVIEDFTKYNGDIYRYLDNLLKIPEVDRINSITFESNGTVYTGIVMAKSKLYPNRYVFKIEPDWNLKAFWVDKIILI